MTDNFWLSQTTDCKKSFDPKIISYTLFILFSSLVPTSLSIANSLSISYIYLIFLFSLISQLSSNIKTLDYIKNSINPTKIMVEWSMDNIEKIKPIPSNFNALKESIFISIFVYFYVVMLYSGVLKTSFFKGSNVINFFN